MINNFDPQIFATVREFAVQTPAGKKKKRFVDIAALKGNKPAVFVQVGKTDSLGNPVSREREAIRDIEAATAIKVIFEDYEK